MIYYSIVTPTWLPRCLYIPLIRVIDILIKNSIYCTVLILDNILQKLCNHRWLNLNWKPAVAMAVAAEEVVAISIAISVAMAVEVAVIQ